MKREYDILQKSGLFVLSNDTNHCPRRLTLRPLQQLEGCGNGIIVTALTVGIIPVFFDAGYSFGYDIEASDIVEHRDHHLQLFARLSIWEWFIEKRSEEELLVKALAFSKLFAPRQQPMEPAEAY